VIPVAFRFVLLLFFLVFFGSSAWVAAFFFLAFFFARRLVLAAVSPSSGSDCARTGSALQHSKKSTVSMRICI
jgi:hypothetical protein